MKKLVFILFVGLIFASCEKQIITPNGTPVEAPVWSQKAVKADVVSDANTIPTHGGTTVDTGVSITDPNDDEDGNGKKKKK